jgi:hypothetical protein
VFHMDVAKVDRDVAHVANNYIRMFQVYVPNVPRISDICYKCFIWMLHIYASVLGVFIRCCKCFHLDVAMFCNRNTYAFLFFLLFCKYFRLM